MGSGFFVFADQQAVVKGVMRRIGLDDKQLKPSAVLSRISWAKNHMLDPQEMYLQSADPITERVAHIFEEYRKELRKANALDFDDLLLESVRLLKADAATREKYQRRFQYMLVDEYQDTNRPQYEIMCALAAAHHNLCAVGDEDQSIYSWRGADIHNILDFEQNFPEAKIIRLEQNYRSTQPILRAASAVVSHNLQRKGKTLWTAREGGSRIGFYEAPDGENEALFAADYIARWSGLRSGLRASQGLPKKAAILYRTNAQSRLMEEALRRYNLKYNVVGGFSFYERAEIKDMIGYLKLILNPSDSVALMRVVNTPPRGIGKTTMETVERVGLETNLTLWGAIEQVVTRRLLPARATAALAAFRELVLDARAMAYGDFVGRMQSSVATAEPEPVPAAIAPETDAELDAEVEAQTGFDFGAADDSFDVGSFEAEAEDVDVKAPHRAADRESLHLLPRAGAEQHAVQQLRRRELAVRPVRRVGAETSRAGLHGHGSPGAEVAGRQTRDRAIAHLSASRPLHGCGESDRHLRQRHDDAGAGEPAPARQGVETR
jgi:DNA helicase-2/ATP-dependent DNA helicase PcrA